MKKIVGLLLLTFTVGAYETPVSNELIPKNPRVAIYIPARIGSTRISNKLLQPIDNQTVIERTYNRAKFIRRANRICVVTNSPEISSLIGENALLINKEYKNGTERICDALFSNPDAKEDIIVNVQGDEPYLDPILVDFAIQKFIESEKDPSVGAVFLHYEITPEEAAQPSKVKIVIDENNYLLYGSRSIIPYGKCSRYFGRMGIMVYRKKALKEFWQHSSTPLEISEDLHWIKLLEMGYKIKSFEVENPVERDVNIPEDLAILSNKYSKPRIFLLRSGIFSNHFVEKINKLWPLRACDLVCRCKKTHGNNLDLFNGKIDYAFFRFHRYIVNPNLKSKNFTAQPSDTSIAVVLLDRTSKSLAKNFCERNNLKYNKDPEFIFHEFLKANNFQHGHIVNKDILAHDFQTETGISIGIPTLGFIGISYLRRNFPDHLIVLVDFTFEGAYGHEWEKEKQYALRLEREGYLIRLLEKAQEHVTQN